ncbi:MAG: nucleotidyltransferase domain-containing protein [Mongoliitalea sp.]
MVKRKTLKIIDDFIKLLQAEGFPIYDAYLFGSYVSGNQSDRSDLDLMLVSDDAVEANDLLVGKIWSLTRKVSTKIEPFVIGKNRFKQSQESPLVEEIKKNGLHVFSS